MANEHSIRVNASGEFGQLERGLKNLKKDLSGVLGEIDKGARSGGLFDDTQLRALDVFRGRFKESMDEMNREFEKQNNLVDDLHRKKEQASRSEREDIEKEIRAREKAMDAIRRQLRATEDLYKRRDAEARDYSVIPGTAGGKQAPASSGSGAGAGAGVGGGLVGLGMSKMLGAGKFVAGLAGIAGIASMASEAYQLAQQSQIMPMDLSQRLRGNGYGGSAKGMWDEIGDIGRNDQMGYTSAESWAFQDQYSRQAGALGPQELEHSMKFGRGYGLEVGETTAALSSVRELGGATKVSEFSNMVAASVEKSGMTPRILEVMQTSAGLLASMNTTLKDTGAKQILAYQTTLDVIGQEKGMMSLTGQKGADLIGGLGGIYSPEQGNQWKWMGLQALQKHDPKKYGNMGLFDLEQSFEDGLMNPDNLPAMAGYIKQGSGGDVNIEKRMLQKWLQDGGYNATKRQTSELYDATNGLTAFDEDKMEAMMDDLMKGDGTAKYQERVGQLGQDILDVNSRFEKQLENLGQPILEMVTGIKEGFTNLMEELTSGTGIDILEEIRDFLKDNWGLLATAAGIAGLATLLSKLVPTGGNGNKPDKDNKPDKNNKPDKDNNNNNKPDRNNNNTPGNNNGGGNNKKPPIVPIARLGTLGGLGALAALGSAAFGVFDTFESGDQEKHENLMKKQGYSDEEIADNTGFWDRLATNAISGLTFGMFSPEDQYALAQGESGEKIEDNLTGFFEDINKFLFPNSVVPYTKEQQELSDKQAEINKKKAEERNEHGWFEATIPDSWGKEFTAMKEGFFKIINESFGTDWGGEKRDAAYAKLIEMSDNGQISLDGMSVHAIEKLKDLAEQGLLKLEHFQTSGYTALNGMSVEGKAELQRMAEQGLISIDGLQADGTTAVTALSEDGKARLLELKEKGDVTFDAWYTGTSATLSGFSEDGKAKLVKLQEQGLISIGGFASDGTAKITALSEQGREELEALQADGSIEISKFSEDGRLKISDLSEKGAKELLELQKNGSLSMVGMDETTAEELESIRKTNKEKMDTIEAEHKSLGERLVGTDGIFTKWADGFGSLWEDLIEELKGMLPSWLGGGGDSSIGFGGNYEGKYGDIINENANKHGIDPLLVASLIKQESGFDTHAISHAGAMGLMQLMPGTARGLGVNNAFDPEQNIAGGTQYLADLIKKYNGNIEHALTAYNWGSGNMDSYLKTGKGVRGQERPKESLEYAQRVMAHYEKMMRTQGNADGGFFNGWEKRITSRYGNQESFRANVHRGLDIDGEQGDSLQALADGKIAFIHMDDGGKYDVDGKKNTRSGGSEIGVEMANGETYFYSHLSKINKQIADAWFAGNKDIKVGAGTYIGNVGGDRGKAGSGTSTTGSHLHLGYMDKNGYLRDPMSLMNRLFGGAGDSDIGMMAAGGMGDSALSKSLDFTKRSLGDVFRSLLGQSTIEGPKSFAGGEEHQHHHDGDEHHQHAGNEEHRHYHQHEGDEEHQHYHQYEGFEELLPIGNLLVTSLDALTSKLGEVIERLTATDAPKEAQEAAQAGGWHEKPDPVESRLSDFEGLLPTRNLLVTSLDALTSKLGEVMGWLTGTSLDTPKEAQEAVQADEWNAQPDLVESRLSDLIRRLPGIPIYRPDTMADMVTPAEDDYDSLAQRMQFDANSRSLAEAFGSMQGVPDSLDTATTQRDMAAGTTSTLNVNVNIEGSGAKELNNMTLTQLRNFVSQILAEKEAHRLSTNPTTGGW